MPEVVGLEKLFSLTAKKRFSRYREFGTSQFAFTNFGDEDVYIIFTEFGNSTFGVDNYANMILFSGIYRSDQVTGKTKWYREPFYITKDPKTDKQQQWRGVFAEAVLAWQGLTEEEKHQYNILGKQRKNSGYNIFLSRYLKSH